MSGPGKGRKAKKAHQGQKPSSRKPKEFKSMRKMNPFLRAIADPCDGGLGARIPDGQLFPTITAQIKLRKTLTLDPNGNGCWMFTPLDVAANITGTATSGLLSRVNVNASNQATSYTHFSAADWASYPQLAALWNQMDSVRVVSACVDLEYIGTTSTDQGLLAGGELPADQMVSNSAGATVVTSFDGFSSMKTVRVVPVRTGLRMKWYPATQGDLAFRDAMTSGTIVASYGPLGTILNAQDQSRASKLYAWVSGGTASQNSYTAMYTLNLEYVPNVGVTTAVPLSTGGAHPQWIQSVFKYTSMVHNVVQGIREVVPLVGSVISSMSAMRGEL
nr:MAG: hypothetical protein 3 [Sobelivirales sp.]